MLEVWNWLSESVSAQWRQFIIFVVGAVCCLACFVIANDYKLAHYCNGIVLIAYIDSVLSGEVLVVSRVSIWESVTTIIRLEEKLSASRTPTYSLFVCHS